MSFTKGPSIVLTYEQVERLTDQLSDTEQLKLAEKLGRKLARTKLLDLILKMRPEKPVPEREILEAAKEARKRVAKRCRDASAMAGC
jgi:hypothetical protein